MDLSVLPEILPRLGLMAVLILLSACFAGSETALFSLSRVARERLARSPNAIDRYIVALLRDPRRLIATILVGNELINITFSSSAAWVVHKILPSAGEVGLVIASTLITVPLLLLLGEITPKTIALRVAEPWARTAARPLGFFAVLSAPVRLVVATIAGGVVRI